MSALPKIMQKTGPPRGGHSVRGKSSDSIRKMAVLFTDVVGSSKYFKTFGDLAGREMLRKHQDLASQPIIEHGGAVVKVLGDSVMAYFTEPGEALKAAVKIQQKFQRNNNGKELKNQIRVRIGLHYGEGIVEKGDIYGDVVNITAKFIPLVQGDEIAISQELHDQMRHVTWAKFERMKPNSTKEILRKLVIYRVLWDENASLDPSLMTVLILRPAWNIAKENFEDVWKNLLQNKDCLWPQTPFRHFAQSDGSLVVFLKKPSIAPSIASNALLFLKKNLARDALPVPPIQILIDTGQFLRAGEPDLARFDSTWGVVKPGEISVSSSAYGGITVPEGYGVIQPGNGSVSPYYRLVSNDADQEDDALLFLFQNAMVRGQYEPCFYCGDQRHRACDCPSKQLSESALGLERLGYMPMEKINEIFFGYLNAAHPFSSMAKQNTNAALDPEAVAGFAFFELKKVFQLRFLRALWNSQSNHWNMVQTQTDDPERGGLIWIGQDCIRVSNLQQAATVLENALIKFPGDFRALCAKGFLCVEQNELQKAKRFFKMALENADTTPRKIFAGFLLARAHELCGEARRADDHIRKILFMDSLCNEALYLDMVSKFKNGHYSDAVRRLKKLIDSNRKYFIASLIDPALGKYSNRIHPVLKEIMDKARNQGTKLSMRATEEMAVIERILGGDASEMRTPRSYMEKIKELSQTDGYFNHLDIIYYATAIIQSAERSHERGRKKLLKAHGRLDSRIRACKKIARRYPYPALMGSLPMDIERAEKEIGQIREVIKRNLLEDFKQNLAKAKELSRDMDRIEHKIRRLEGMRRWIAFGVDFSKKALVLEGSIAFISLLLFPIVGHYLNFLIPELSFSPSNIWKYQKGVLFLGGGVGLFLAFLMSARKLGDN